MRAIILRTFAAVSAVLLAGCSLRAIAIVETEDAVYGKTSVEKDQKYDKQRNHLGFFESLMGTLNPSTLDSLSHVVNGGGTVTEEPSSGAPPAPVIVSPSAPVLVHP